MTKLQLLLSIILLLFTSAVAARLVEVQGSAIVENGMTGKARALAIQDAISQAAVYGGATVQSQTRISNHTVTMDAASVTATGQVKNVHVMDEWQTENVLHVRIRADVNVVGNAGAVASGYRKKIAFTQFEVANRSGMYDLPALETLFPRLLLNKLQEQGVIVGIDATKYLMSAQENRHFRQNDPPNRDTVVKIAQQLGVQFVVNGIIHDMSWRRDRIGQERDVVMELQILDGISGMVISRYTFSETLWGGKDILAVNDFGSEAFFKHPLGKILEKFAIKQIEVITRDIGQLPFSARVIKSEGKRVYFDAGAASLVNVGDVFMAYSQGEGISGLLNQQFLGREEQAAATLVVKKVQPLFAMGELEAGAEHLKPGDIVRITW